MISKERMAELTQALRDAGRLPRRPGVLTLTRGRVNSVDMYWTICSGQAAQPAEEGLDAVDFNDDATVGVLAGWARELWEDDNLYAVPSCDTRVAIDPPITAWTILFPNGQAASVSKPTRVEAWVDAVLCAPGGAQ